MSTPDPADDNLPVIRRRDGTIRADIDPADLQPLQQREPIRVARTRRIEDIPEPRTAARHHPARATTIAHTATSIGHLVGRVLPRYLLAALITGAAVWFLTGALWVVLLAVGLVLAGWVWWVSVVLRQAAAYRRGEAPPPPGWTGF